MKKRILSLLLAVVMCVGLLPTVAMADGEETAADSPNKTIMLGTGGIEDPTPTVSGSGTYHSPNSYIYFGVNGTGSSNSSGPIKWRVLESEMTGEDNTSWMFLLSEYLLSNSMEFDGESNSWQDSDARSWCISYANSESNFTSLEQGAMLGVAKTDSATNRYGRNWGESSLTESDKLFFLSADELAFEVGDWGLVATYSNGNSVGWWLRSPHALNTSDAGVVNLNGDVYCDPIDNGYSARPAFNLDLSSVLFTSAAVGGKASSTADAIFEIGDYSGNEWKLTLLDRNRRFAASASSGATTVQPVGYTNWTISLEYSNATTGENEYISVMIVDDSEEVLYYGRVLKLDGTTDPTNGTVEITVPSDLAAGDYTLYVFNEQYNGGEEDDTYLTDYASEFSEVKLTVDNHDYDENGFCSCGAYEPAEQDENDVYQIENAGNLYWFAALVNGDTTQDGITEAVPDADAELTCDIALNPYVDELGEDGTLEWTPIGDYGAYVNESYMTFEFGQAYSGTFDGNGHTISGLYINAGQEEPTYATAYRCYGLFGCVYDGTVKGIVLADSSITVGETGDTSATLYVGGIVAGLQQSTLSGCASSATISATAAFLSTTSTTSYVGGIVGFAQDATITNCYNTGDISGLLASGIVPVGLDTTIENCYNAGAVSTIDSEDGGYAAIAQSVNCYYLEGTGESSSSMDSYATSKTAEEFASGEVAWLLQGSQSNLIWGQDLTGRTASTGDNDFPVLTDNSSLAVVKIEFYLVEDGVVAGDPFETSYTNYNSVLSAYPVAASGTYAFYSDETCSSSIDEDEVYTQDTKVYVENVPDTVSVTGVTLNLSTLDLTVGDEVTLTATVSPENATDQSVTWTSSDGSVATVDANGTVTAVSPGTAIITATTIDGGYTASCTVIVSEEKVYELSGKVVEKDGTEIENVTVELQRGGETIDTAVTNKNGYFIFRSEPAGVYNLVVTRTTSEGVEQTVTILETLEADDDVTITMPRQNINATLSVDNSSTGIMAGGLIEEAEAQGGGSSATVTLTMNVEHGPATVEDQKKIEQIAEDGAALTYLDITLTLSRSGESDVKITDTKGVVTIAIPYTFTDGKDVVVYRCHEGRAEKLTAASSSKVGVDGYYYQDRVNGILYIYATQFSTYAYEEIVSTGTSTYDYDYSSDISYRITTATTTNGTIAVSDTRAYEGDKVTITVTPDDGYELSSLTVTTSSGREVKLTQKSNTKYTFTMPSSKVTITATFVEIEEKVLGTLIKVNPTTPFTDISNSRFKSAIAEVYAAGLMNGVSETEFDPEGTLTRGMAVTVLYRLAGEPEVSGSSGFSDVETGLWYSDAVAWAATTGVVNGYTDGTFKPEQAVTREELATILYRYASSNGYYVGNTFALDGFKDNEDVQDYATTAMEWAVANSVLVSRTTAMLNPSEPATRAEVAQAVSTLIK